MLLAMKASTNLKKKYKKIMDTLVERIVSTEMKKVASAKMKKKNILIITNKRHLCRLSGGFRGRGGVRLHALRIKIFDFSQQK